MYEEAKFLPAGDRALVMELGAEVSPVINRKIRNLSLGIRKQGIKGIEELLPTYRSILINYNPLLIQRRELIRELKKIEKSISDFNLPQPKLVEIPICYGGEYGLDLEYVAQYNNLSPIEVIELHSAEEYLIYMLGFTPGFAYLGGLAEQIATPRLKEPRVEIPAGSVGIAGQQTGIYPISSPGGWQLIGRTPLKLFDPQRQIPILEGIKAGNYLKFIPITEVKYEEIKEKVESGEY
ncbi:5-oxoprolinase subunit PxpB [Fuchsiella alkaliacetigena]|uniref:5-oxoprolinase subunit PxpB n=1 Tax=Fuchsiella alkaliacetigena TaxID=957042 RepID=UPI00200B037F|nr:5-oxoprolinase subunit PxpB [Fuchsiella alkaliacetigena]MCK8825410.1 5-oxoprolinase subunit PxpB [Fuchsiella alkaliacetigena]